MTAAGFVVESCASTVPGLYGPEGLLMHPDRLDAYIKRADLGGWDYEEGSNLFLLCRKAAAVAVKAPDEQPCPVRVEVGA